MRSMPKNLAGIAGLHRRTRARITGTIVGLYDAARAGIEVEPTTPWATVCEDHSTSVCHENQGLALKALADPSSWCDFCRNGIAAGTPELRARARKLARDNGPWTEEELDPNTSFPTPEAVEALTLEEPRNEQAVELRALLLRISLLEEGHEPAERPPTGEELLETPALEAEVAMVEERLEELRAEVREHEDALARKKAILAKRDPKRDPLLARGGAFCTPCVGGLHEGCVGPGCGCNCANGPSTRQV